jgi:predicted transcriptional regulator
MTDHDEILISLKPKHASQVFGGEKTVELRKRRPNISPGARIWIYATSPTAAIKGYANLIQIQTGPPSLIWKKFGNQTGISKDEFDLYFDACGVAHALMLTDVMEMKRALPLKRIRELVGRSFHPPQFFCYLNGERKTMRLTSRKHRPIKNDGRS